MHRISTFFSRSFCFILLIFERLGFTIQSPQDEERYVKDYRRIRSIVHEHNQQNTFPSSPSVGTTKSKEVDESSPIVDKELQLYQLKFLELVRRKDLDPSEIIEQLLAFEEIKSYHDCIPYFETCTGLLGDIRKFEPRCVETCRTLIEKWEHK